MTTLALIGAGKWGQNYLKTAATLNNVKIKYICVRSRKKLNSFPDTYVKTLSVEELLKNKDIDGFVIATPAITHFAIARKALSLGRNLLIEKPLTTNYGQALQLQKIWQIKKPKVLTGHLYLYNPAYQVFKSKFMRIREVKTISFEGFNSPVRNDVSVIWDWGPHPVSLLLDLVKDPISEISATGSKKTGSNLLATVDALIIYQGGIKASIRISWFGPSKVRKLTVEGKNARLELDYANTKSPRSALSEELLEFVKAIQSSKKIKSDFNFGVRVVKILSAIEQSTTMGGQRVTLDKN